MSKGSGRGRGWLKLEKSKEAQRPGVDLNKFEPARTQIIPQEKNTYDELIVQFECLNPNDDGILLNKKIQHIRDFFMDLCNTEEETAKAVKAINRKCLRDEQFIEKFILLVTSAFFNNKQTTKPQKAWKENVRRSLINGFQENFENRELLRKTTPTMFYNSLKLCSSFFWNIRKVLPNGYPIIESQAVIGYLHTLLDFGEPLDIKMFAVVVCENIGILVKLYEEKQPQLITLLDNIKLALISDERLSKKEKMLLFFAWDLVRHKYQITPEDLAFYKTNLGEDDIKDILMKYNYLNKLDIECPEIKNGRKKDYISQKEDDCVNSLLSSHRMSSFPEKNTLNNSTSNSSSLNSSKSQNSNDQYGFNHINYLPNDSSDQITQPLKSINLENEFVAQNVHSNNQQNQGEKIGRPILGIGARLKRN